MAIGTRVYSDIDIAFKAHPVTGDITKKTDYMAVNQAIKTLVLTSHYEKPFHPEIGSNIRRLLFELMDNSTTAMLREEIRNVIENFEPRVRIEDIIVTPNYDKNWYVIDIVYSILNIPNPVRIQFFLERLR